MQAFLQVNAALRCSLGFRIIVNFRTTTVHLRRYGLTAVLSVIIQLKSFPLTDWIPHWCSSSRTPDILPHLQKSIVNNIKAFSKLSDLLDKCVLVVAEMKHLFATFQFGIKSVQVVQYQPNAVASIDVAVQSSLSSCVLCSKECSNFDNANFVQS